MMRVIRYSTACLRRPFGEALEVVFACRGDLDQRERISALIRADEQASGSVAANIS